MAGTTRTLEFSEGVSVSEPVTTFLQTTQFATYADDATFVSNKGSAAADGDAYYNTTTDVVRVYANGSWQNVYDDSDTNIVLADSTQTISGDKTFSSAVNISDTTQSTDKDTGALIVEGGIGVEKNLNVGGNVDITGDLNVSGTTTSVDDLVVTDETVTVNNGGTQASADTNDAGLIVSMSDATNATVHYDSSATSKWKAGEVGSTDEVVTISASQQLTNKDIDGGTASNSNRITLPKAGTSTLNGLTRKEGTVVFDSDTLKVKYDDGTNLNELGGGAGGINYIENGDAEGGTTGWVTYADAADTKPVNGVDGSPTITWTASSSAPLRGLQSFVLTKDASNRQGEGASYDFNIDNTDLHSALSISFDAITSANYADDDVVVYIYNTDSSELIEPVPVELKAGEYGQYFAQWQSHPTDNSYRLIIHVSSTNSSAYTVKIDNIRVGPSERNFGTPVTDWVEYTPTFNSGFTVGTGGNANQKFLWRRVGDSMEIAGSFTLGTSGASMGSGNFTFTPPSGFSIDDNKAGDQHNGFALYGQAKMFDSTASDLYGDDVVRNLLTDNFEVYNNTSNAAVSATSPFTWAAGDVGTFKLSSIPISGWGSTVQMSDDADTRVVAFRARLTNDQVVTTQAGDGEKIQLDSVDFDSHGAWDSGNYYYVIPYSGYYNISGNLRSDTITGHQNAPTISINNAGVADQYFGSVNIVRAEVNQLLYLSKGDTVQLNLWQNESTSETVRGGTGTNADGTFLSIVKVTGPSAIAANELVACRYTTDSGQSISSGSDVTTVFDTKDFDTHGIYNTGTGVGTIPVSGKYLICSANLLSSAAWTLNTRALALVKRDGTTISYSGTAPANASVTIDVYTQQTEIIDFTKGQTFEIGLNHNRGSATSLTASNLYNYFSIQRLGF